MSSNMKSNELRRKWLNHEAVLSSKELLINKYQVMQSWEGRYMEDLANIATSNGGEVLELGFGMGISAGFIQNSKKIKSHTIIECHPDVISYASKKYAKNISSGKLTLINGFWENVSYKLKDNFFSGILFDTSPINKETVFFHYLPFFKEAFRLLKKGGVFTYFSDEPDELSPRHLKLLEQAGFTKIKYHLCQVRPPKSCRYWQYKTIVSPIIQK